MLRRTMLLLTVPFLLAIAPPAWATYPGANGTLVFQRPAGEQMDLFTLSPGGGRPERLIGGPAFDDKPEWSPDGTRIAFSRSGSDPVPEEIWTADARGGDLRPVTNWGRAAAAPSWAPDGRIVYFTTKDFPAPASADDPPPPSEIYSAAPDGSDQRRLTNEHVMKSDPEVSSDGTIASIAFEPVAGEPGAYHLGLYAISAGGGAARPIIPFSRRRDVFACDWSPDGTRLVVELALPGPGGSARESDLAVVGADGRGLHRITHSRALETDPVWSPDGRSIAFTSDRHVARGPRERNGAQFELYRMRADGGHVRRLTRNHVADLYPSWQPRVR